MTKNKNWKQKIGHWWKENEALQWLKEKVTIKRFLIVLSVLGNIIMLVIIVAMI